MWRWIAAGVGVLGLAVWLVASEVAGYWVPVWVGTRYQWLRLGRGLVVRDTYIEVVPAPQRVLVPGVVLSRPYDLPADCARLVAVYLNGLRATAGVDYLVRDGRIVPQWEWPDDAVVVIDYERVE